MNGKFSVIVPALNAKAYLRPCIDSIKIAQSFYPGPVEIIVVDNGSTDGTWQHLQEMARYGDVIAKQLTDVTVAAVRNYGASCGDLDGEFLCFIDCDCLMHWDYFAQARLALVGRDASGSKHDIPDTANWIEKTWYELHARPKDGPVNYVNSGNFVITRRAFHAIGGFDVTAVTCEDVELCQRLKKNGFTVYESHSVRAMHLGGDKTLAVFFRKNVWRGLGMFQLGKAANRLWFMAMAYVVFALTGLAVLCITAVPALIRLLLCLGLVNLIPAVAVAYRVRQNGRFYKPVQSVLLYHVFLAARFCAICKSIFGGNR
jgi:glycosyltransferase involved in cell wall biosynthesis